MLLKNDKVSYSVWLKTWDAASYQFYDTQNNFCIFKSKSFCLNRLQNVFNQSSLWNLSLTNWIWLLVVYLRVNDRMTRVTEFCWKWNGPVREANTSSASTEEKLVRLQRSSSCFGPERVGSGWTSQWTSVQTENRKSSVPGVSMISALVLIRSLWIPWW